MELTWLLMFYSMPSKPERNRLRIYRRLQKEGTLSLKDGVHILPFNEDRYEFFQWLSQEIKTLGGEMQFVTIQKIEMMDNSNLVALFHKQAEVAYGDLEKRIECFSSDSTQEQENYQKLKKMVRDFDALSKIDFFDSPKGKKIQKALQSTQKKLDALFQSSPKPSIQRYDRTHFQGKQWQTRTRPFVDRMASAWLIKKYIDPKAEFIFANTIHTSSTVITYDMNQGDFTHIGDLCTFEVLVQAFGIDDVAIHELAKIIHNLDLNDDKYDTPQAEGIKLILSAIRKNSSDDHVVLSKSAEIFDYLYGTLLSENTEIGV